jgi:hypothetical protein
LKSSQQPAGAFVAGRISGISIQHQKKTVSCAKNRKPWQSRERLLQQMEKARAQNSSVAQGATKSAAVR